MATSLLELRELTLHLGTPFGRARVLRGVSLDVARGSVVGLVGESGCGKTMTGRAIMGMLPPSASLAGNILFEGQDLLRLSSNTLRQFRGKRIAMIFQDPNAALNPVFTIGEQLTSILAYHRIATTSDGSRRRALELLDEVGLPDPQRILQSYPHELSGGMQQRAMIAMALSASPQLLIADEPTTALDVTIQAQVLGLLAELRLSRELTVILITHNIAVVQAVCDSVAVLYAGRVVEQGPVQDVIARPAHPYTKALLAALPTSAGRRQPLAVIHGHVPESSEVIEGCVFASRCPHVMAVCTTTVPEMRPVDRSRRTAACWLYADGGSVAAK